MGYPDNGIFFIFFNMVKFQSSIAFDKIKATMGSYQETKY